MLIGVIGCGRGLRMQVGAGYPFSTHIAFNCNVGTLFGYKSRNAAKQAYIKHPKGHYADRSRGAWQGAENAGGSQAPF